ncbi:MAG TPA: hypothetical protein VD966_14030 [Pyrinomonadaceae bacterium]|nr:hypothetical protein [Pyrinomonadaceae bacterium]
MSGPKIWAQDKEKVDNYMKEEYETRAERGKSIEDAGGKSDEL